MFVIDLEVGHARHSRFSSMFFRQHREPVLTHRPVIRLRVRNSMTSVCLEMLLTMIGELLLAIIRRYP